MIGGSYDVLSTRRHWYRKYLVYRYANPVVVVKKTTVGQEQCDSDIIDGTAIPVGRHLESIADAIPYIAYANSIGLAYFFIRMLAMPERFFRWEDFLQEAAEETAEDYLLQCVHNLPPESNLVDDICSAAIAAWRIWYREEGVRIERSNLEHKFFFAVQRTVGWMNVYVGGRLDELTI
jgi:hypothetical protein